MFKDETIVQVIAGRGGDGCVSFRREAFAPRGGPDGGDGGRGGSVLFVADRDETSLLPLTRRRTIKAGNGQMGMGSNCHGKDAEDVIVKVPTGTLIYDADSGELIADLKERGASRLIARGGKGGRGNKQFATATHQTPREFEHGRPGEERRLRVELKLIADIGLVGLPNAGKSTLLARCSRARPKIAAYPFTTLEPQLGIVERGFAPFVMADIPGLIEGASEGKGLGHQFLRHVERTRVILHLVDLAAGEVERLLQNYGVIRRELERFSPTLASKPEILAGNKMDITEGAENLAAFESALGKKVWPLSGVSGEGLEDVLKEIDRVMAAG